MGYNYFFLIFIIAFIQAPKPENIRIFNIEGSNSNKMGTYEFNVLKNEIFGLQFTSARGTDCHWSHSNDAFLKESNYLRFLNSTTWDYISEEYEKELEKVKSSTNQIEIQIEPIDGGNEYYYELFKALDEGNQPQSLYFTYSCGDDIIEKLCNNSLTEEECASAEAINPKTSKCVYDNIQKVCKEEKKFCNEIKDGATEEICSNVQVSEANNICVFDKGTNSCNEFFIIKNEKNDANNDKKNISLYYFLYLLLLFI